MLTITHPYAMSRLLDAFELCKNSPEPFLKSLLEQLRYLHTYGCQLEDGTYDLERVKIELGADCRRDEPPVAFAFTAGQRQQTGIYRRWFVGGLVCHGLGEVSLHPITVSPDVGWQIHT